MEISSKKTDC